MLGSSSTNPDCVRIGECNNGGKLLGDLLYSVQLYVCEVDAYPDSLQITSYQVCTFFLAYTQDYLKSEIFMEIPIGFGIEWDHQSEWIIIMDKTLYGKKNTGLAWFEKLKEGLEFIGFLQSQFFPVCGIERRWFYYFMLVVI